VGYRGEEFVADPLPFLLHLSKLSDVATNSNDLFSIVDILNLDL
jgi:hypothetical protein